MRRIEVNGPSLPSRGCGSPVALPCRVVRISLMVVPSTKSGDPRRRLPCRRPQASLLRGLGPPSFPRCGCRDGGEEPSSRHAIAHACGRPVPGAGDRPSWACALRSGGGSEEHTSELQSRGHLVCRLLLEKKKTRE